MLFDIFIIAHIKILIFSLCALRMAVTLQVRVDTLTRLGAFEVIRVGAGDTVKTRAAARCLTIVGIRE